MEELKGFADIAPFLRHPLVLGGFALLLFFGIHRHLIKSGLIPPLTQRTGSRVIQTILRYGFVIALVVIVLGFALEFYKVKPFYRFVIGLLVIALVFVLAFFQTHRKHPPVDVNAINP